MLNIGDQDSGGGAIGVPGMSTKSSPVAVPAPRGWGLPQGSVASLGGGGWQSHADTQRAHGADAVAGLVAFQGAAFAGDPGGTVRKTGWSESGREEWATCRLSL